METQTINSPELSSKITNLVDAYFPMPAAQCPARLAETRRARERVTFILNNLIQSEEDYSHICAIMKAQFKK